MFSLQNVIREKGDTMKNFAGKICFITGAGSGLGLGQAKVFAKAGMKVALGDIRADALHKAATEVMEYAGCGMENVLTIPFDLTDRQQFLSAAETIEKVFGGPPHLLIQTAGVNSFGPVEASTYDDFDWIVGVCFDGVVNGMITFVPRMLRAYGGTNGAHKEEFHIVNVASLGGLESGPDTGPYSAAKAAVINLTYSYADNMIAYGGHASVLCPWNINSNIGICEQFRPERFSNRGYHVTEKTIEMLKAVHATGQDPVDLAEVMKKGIEEDRVLIMPFRDEKDGIDWIDSEYNKTRLYMLPEKERLEKTPAGLSDPTHLYEYYNLPDSDDMEPFGLAKADNDFVAPNRKIGGQK